MIDFSPLSFQTRPQDLQYQRFIQSLYAFPTPRLPFYPQSPYGMGGLRGNCSIPGPPFCGEMTYDQILQMFGVENCTTYDAAGDVQGSYDCTQRNFPKLYGPTNSVSAWQQGCCDSGQPVYGTSIPFTPATPTGYTGPVIYQYGPGGALVPLVAGSGAPSGGTRGTGAGSAGSGPPRVTFTAQRAGSTFQPGDQWQIQITGGAPMTNVSASSVHNGAASGPNVMGQTDANGNLTLNGSFGSDELGTWSEQWFVGSTSAGSFSFTVAQPATSPPPYQGGAGTGAGTGSGTPASGSSGAGAPVTNPPSSGLPATILGVPTNYVLLGGAAVLLMALAGGRG